MKQNMMDETNDNSAGERTTARGGAWTFEERHRREAERAAQRTREEVGEEV